MILVALPNQLPYSRFGFTASKRIGKAVTRNRARRRMREAVRLRMKEIKPGWDLVFIARKPIVHATFQEIQAATEQLLAQADLLNPSVSDAVPAQSS